MTGQKLLLADDSVTIQKVIDLTFSDEGMQVVTVNDGDEAIRTLEEFTPDIVLADVLMPGVNGYRLCEFMKQSEQFGRIPVMLLVGSFEPFDEAEARRVGADDFVTKPFQSIRQLVSRVGSLLGGKAEDEKAMTRELSTLGLQTPPAESDVRVKADEIADADSSLSDAVSESQDADIELQTADTLRFRDQQPDETYKRDAEPPNLDDAARETKPMEIASETVTSTNTFSDALLDLDDLDAPIAIPEPDDAILDIEYGTPLVAGAVAAPETHQPAAVNEYHNSGLADVSKEAPVSSWAIVEEHAAVENAFSGEAEGAKVSEAPAPHQITLSELSPEAIDAIARRVVEQLSDKVVREIAWDVVPELSELLIKQRLDEQNR